MADGITDGPWPIEEIPDSDTVYMRVLAIHTTEVGGRLVPTSPAIRNHGDQSGPDGMSTDWDRYATADSTRRGSPRRPASDYGVVSFSVVGVRAIPGQTVIQSPINHDPAAPDLPNNRAHTDVFGPKSKGDVADKILLVEISNRFRVLACWQIRPDAPVR